MSSAAAANPARVASTILAVAGSCVFGSGILVLLGWLLNVSWLRAPFPGYAPMKLLTATTLVLLGAALLCLRFGQPGTKCRQLARSCAVAGALSGAFSLSMFLLECGAVPGMETAGASLRSLRSAPSTALCCMLLGGAVLLIDSQTRRSRMTVTGLALAASALACLALIGYACQTPQLARLGTSIPMALQTALTLLAACVGVFCVCSDSGLPAMMASDSAGGVLARRLLLPALAIPLALCWLVFVALEGGLLEDHLGLALQALATSVVLVGLIWITCLSFHRVDLERLQEQRNLQQARAELEAAVRERTARLGSANEALTWECAVNASLAELAQALITSASMDDVAAQMLQCAKKLTGSPFGLAGYVEQETGRLLCPTLERDTWEICQAPEGEAALRKLSRLWERMVAERKTVLVNLPSAPPGTAGVLPGNFAVYRCLSAPALLDGRVAGQVAVAAPRNFTERDVAVMGRLASLLAIAIQQQRACRKLREAQAQLVQSAKMAAVGQLAAGIAHEINNPMAVISTSAETLQAFLAGRPGAREVLGPLWDGIGEQIENIDASVFRCKAIIDSLLDFSRAEALEDTDVAVLLAHALRLIRASKQGRERALALKVSGQTVFVWNGTGARDADPVAAACLPLKTSRHQLQQVVLNLVANAVDATTLGGSVTVDAGRRGNGVEITVADNGRGIVPENRAHLFEPFFTTKPLGKGTGLGLYLSHRIVSALGGTIECETEAGRGTTMKVWLPAAALEV